MSNATIADTILLSIIVLFVKNSHACHHFKKHHKIYLLNDHSAAILLAPMCCYFLVNANGSKNATIFIIIQNRLNIVSG